MMLNTSRSAFDKTAAQECARHGSSAIIEVRQLVRLFTQGWSWFGGKRTVRAVDDISLDIRTGETLAVVGESGSGKSTFARLLTDLIHPTSGQVVFKGVDIGTHSKKDLRKLRKEVQFIFQDPFSSLNPRMTVGAIIEEPMRIHKLGSKEERRKRTANLLRRVGMRSEHANLYPHEFSGGQRQRIGIARALASNPSVLIGDEPVSALDVSVQAQVINLIEDLKEEFNLTLILISHDLAVIRHMSDRVAVMYLGQIVELASNDQLFKSPLHPYTQALMQAVPMPVPNRTHETVRLEGEIPSPHSPPKGCRFHTRCPYKTKLCETDRPLLGNAADGRSVACHHWQDLPAYTHQIGKLHRTESSAKRFALYRELSEKMASVHASQNSVPSNQTKGESSC